MWNLERMPVRVLRIVYLVNVLQRRDIQETERYRRRRSAELGGDPGQRSGSECSGGGVWCGGCVVVSEPLSG